MSHKVEVIQRGGKHLAFCHDCGNPVSDPATEIEAEGTAIYHRRYEAPRIEGRAA